MEDRPDETSGFPQHVRITSCCNPNSYRMGVTAAVEPDREVRPCRVLHVIEETGEGVGIGGDEASNEAGWHRAVASEIPGVDQTGLVTAATSNVEVQMCGAWLTDRHHSAETDGRLLPR